MISLYQKYLSPITHFILKNVLGFGYECRFTPTCSEYSKKAIAKHGLAKGGFLSIKRILRCNSLFPGGNDPVPDKI